MPQAVFSKDEFEKEFGPANAGPPSPKIKKGQVFSPDEFDKAFPNASIPQPSPAASLAYKQETARQQFEQATPAAVDPLNYYAGRAGDKLYNFFANALNSLKSDELSRPQDPNPTWAKAAQPLVDIGKGIKNAALAPYRLTRAKTPEQVQDALFDVWTQTLPLGYGALRGGAEAIPEGTPNALMELGAKIKNLPRSQNPGLVSQAIDLVPGMRLAEDTLKENVGNFVSGVGKGMMEDPVRSTTPPAGASVTSKPSNRVPKPPPLTQPQDPFAPQYQAAGVESVPHDPELAKLDPKLTIEKRDSLPSWKLPDEPKQFSYQYSNLPRFKTGKPVVPAPKNTLKEISAGIPPERINQLGGPSKLIDIAKDVDSIQANKGFDVMAEKVDPLVGGAFGRQRLLASTEVGSEAQNVIAKLVRAYKQGDLPSILKMKDQLQGLAKRNRQTILPPPPPG